MKLADYLAGRKGDVQASFVRALASVRNRQDGWQRFLSNVYGEGQPEELCWESFVTFFSERSEINSAYDLTLHIRKHSKLFQLKGHLDPRATGSCILTRLVPLAAFARLVYEQDSDGMTLSQVLAYLAAEVFDRPPAELPTAILKMQLGLYVIWAALDLPPLSDQEAAQRAACRCGLPADIANGPIVSIQYRLPAGARAYAPTVFDAYGGWPWPPHFRVGTWDGTQYVGGTEPRPDCAGETGYREVVSWPVLLSAVCGPIRKFD